MRAADVLATRLYAAGCRYGFGMPGGEVLTLVDALEKAGIEFILIKHENAGGFMAEGVYHRTGAPAILIATLGPGVANAVNVIANADQDRVPMIFLTGCVDVDDAHSYTHQIFDHKAVLEPITRATFTLSADSAHIICDKAVNLAMAARPGPVHIDVPISVADAPVKTTGESLRTPQSPVAPAPGRDLDQARQWLGEAQKPIMIIGVDVLSEGCAKAAQTFAQKFQIPVLTTYKAKGVLSEDDALALGGIGLSPVADRELLPFVEQADLIVCAGYDPIEMRTGWQNVWSPKTQNIIDITTAPNTHYMHQASLSFVCNIAAGLAAISENVTPASSWDTALFDTTRAHLRTAFRVDEDWGPAAIVETVRTEMPKDTVAAVDAGAHRILLSQVWQCYQPGGLLQSTGLCTMGCALPLAMGVKIASPETPVVAFAGDAGMLMCLGELATAAELKLSLTIIVFVDASLSLIEIKQRGRQLKNTGVDFDIVDFAATAIALGGNGITVSSRDELKQALKISTEAKCFTVIGCIIDRQAYDGRI